ncbi:MAG: DUF1501 domain-containing protein [Rhodoferax sp.]
MPTTDLFRARRAFLRRASAIAVASGSPLGLNLLAAGAACAQTAGDFKALVCIHLAGGNDQSNTLVPMHNAGYTAYAQARPTLALPRDQLLSLSLYDPGGQMLGLNPALAALKPLFDQGRIAVLANVGPLAAPITKAQWNRGAPTVPVPLQLTSHSDQTGAWHTAIADRVSETGWMGRAGDLMAPIFNTDSSVSVAMSTAGNTMLQVGHQTLQYQLTAQGAVKVRALDGLYNAAAGGNALRAIMTMPRSHYLEQNLTRIGARAIASETTVSNALATVQLATAFPATGLGRQLQIVARMIAARGALQQGRQLYFVQQGGYDFHDNLLGDQAQRLQELGDAMAAFQAAIEALGVASGVTAFTTSEFGRALQSNGRGADHGWGSHHLIMGGAVLGNRVYGQFPEVALGAAQDAGQGRLIPTTSVDEYVATLARWWGVPDDAMHWVAPNLDRFPTPNLGFLA